MLTTLYSDEPELPLFACPFLENRSHDISSVRAHPIQTLTIFCSMRPLVSSGEKLNFASPQLKSCLLNLNIIRILIIMFKYKIQI